MLNPLEVQIVPDVRPGWHVRVVDAKNHKVIYWTQHYRRKDSADYAAMIVKRNMATAPVVDLTSPLHSALVRALRKAS